MLKLRLLLPLVLLTPGLLTPGLVNAHAGLVKSSPGSRSVLTQTPQEIELCFSEAVELKFSTIKLVDASKVAVPLAEPQLRSDPKCFFTSVPALSGGTYTVSYRVLSQDGHVVEYGYQFSVKPASGVK